MNNPKVSIITPTYNSSLFIKRTVESVRAQTFTDWEYLIVDDHSTDNTTELIGEFIRQDPRIKLLQTSQNSGGPATPKNVGVERAVGQYIAFLDHDDEWLPEKLAEQLKIFDNSKDEKLGVISCFLNIRDNDGKLLYKHKKNYRGNIIERLANGNFIVTSSCVVIKTEIFKEVGLFDIDFKTSDDWDMWLRISKAGYHFDYEPKYLINYISHGLNAHMENNNRNDQKEFILLYNKHKDLFLKYNIKAVGHYYFYIKEYAKARKYFIKNIFSKKSDCKQKIKSLIFIIITFFPKSEILFRKIFSKIKTLYKF